MIVSVVIPTYKRPQSLQRLLKSLLVSKKDTLDIIVVNNDDKPLQLKKISNNIRVIENIGNKGLAHARTQGALVSQGNYILFIDDDNVVDMKMIEELTDSLDKYPELVAVGPLTFYLDEKKKVWFLRSSFNLTTSMPKFFKEYTSDDFWKPNLVLTENLHNCFMIRKSAGDKVMWFDEKVFMGGTEYDLFRRLKKQNKKQLIATNVNAHCYHDVPLYSHGLLRSLGFESKLRVYYFQRNRGVHVGRYGTGFDKVMLFLFFYPLFLLGYSALFILKGRLDLLIEHIKGTIAGYYYLVKPL
jgi:GT2 family glycosyltransferase